MNNLLHIFAVIEAAAASAGKVVSAVDPEVGADIALASTLTGVIGNLLPHVQAAIKGNLASTSTATVHFAKSLTVAEAK